MENIDIKNLAAQTAAYKKCLGIAARINAMPLEKLDEQKRTDIIILRDVLIDSKELAQGTMLDVSFINDALKQVKILLRGVR